MRPLRYSINVTLDGCCHHEAGLPPDEESMRYWTGAMGRADALLFGRVTYEMMESAWRQPASGTWPDWMDEWEIPFAETIDRAKKYVVSSTLSGVDWNAELVRGDLGQAVQRLKQEPGDGLFVGGLTLPLALADLGLIDEYEFLLQPVLAGHGRRCSPVCANASSSSWWIAMSSGRGRSPCDTGPRELRLDGICPGTLAAASRRNDGSGGRRKPTPRLTHQDGIVTGGRRRAGGCHRPRCKPVRKGVHNLDSGRNPGRKEGSRAAYPDIGHLQQSPHGYSDPVPPGGKGPRRRTLRRASDGLRSGQSRRNVARPLQPAVPRRLW